jgi:hypothetical protein
MNSYCLYYQAHVEKKYCWFVLAVLRSFEHVAFDRTLDKEKSIFEFFVPVDMKFIFLSLMRYLQQEGFVTFVHQQPNRLA